MLIYPLLSLLRMSFFDIEPLRHPDPIFSGFENYVRLLRDPNLHNSLAQTAFWTFGSVTIQFGIGIVAAIILNETFRGRGLARAFLLIPWAMPSVVGAFAWKWVYHAQLGLLNHILTSLHLVSHNVNWLGDPATAMIAAVITNSWRGFPFMMLMLLAGMQNIPQELYDASAVDGASFWQQLRLITLPLLKPVIFVITLLSSIWTFNNFSYIYILTGGGPAGMTEILVTYVYKNGFQFFHFGYAAALSVLLFAVVVVMSFAYIRLMSRGDVTGD
ncbi:MAG: sugar ABC transporter permease [Anaerolineales bacterium]